MTEPPVCKRFPCAKALGWPVLTACNSCQQGRRHSQHAAGRAIGYDEVSYVPDHVLEPAIARLEALEKARGLSGRSKPPRRAVAL